MTERDIDKFAQDGGKARWDGVNADKRSAHAKDMNKARWKGHTKGKKDCACNGCEGRRAFKSKKK